MAEFDLDSFLSPNDVLSRDEFLIEYPAVEALIEEAEEAGDANLLEIYEEKLASLEHENPQATARLKAEQLKQLDRNERRTRLQIAEAIIKARKN